MMRPMAKAARQFVCQECGGVSSKWAGKCEACGAWNAMAEEAVESSPWTGAKNPNCLLYTSDAADE